jgi:sugar-specific transcriptional regulator TrmB
MKNLSSILGIPERDLVIFRLLNSLGAMPASSVASRLGMNRTTAFSALRRLGERGLVFEIPKKSGNYFSAVEPDRLLREAEKKVLEEKKKFSMLTEFAKELETERNQDSARPAVSFYEGENGIISLFQKTLLLGSEQSAFLTLEKFPNKVKEYLMKDYIAQKKKRGVQSRVLIPESSRAKKYRSLDFEGNRETRFCSQRFYF